MTDVDDLDLRGNHILVIEDDIFIGSTLAEHLRELGAQVSWLTSFSDAIAAAGDIVVNLAIVDLNLDGSLSTPIIDQLLNKHTPMILCTGYDEESIEARHRGLPRAQKPFTRGNIRRLLTAALQRP